jgi:hypothetical protein
MGIGALWTGTLQLFYEKLFMGSSKDLLKPIQQCNEGAFWALSSRLRDMKFLGLAKHGFQRLKSDFNLVAKTLD